MKSSLGRRGITLPQHPLYPTKQCTYILRQAVVPNRMRSGEIENESDMRDEYSWLGKRWEEGRTSKCMAHKKDANVYDRLRPEKRGRRRKVRKFTQSDIRKCPYARRTKYDQLTDTVVNSPSCSYAHLGGARAL